MEGILLKNEAENLLEDAEFKTLEELIQMNITEIPFLLEGVIPERGIGFLQGPSDSNKSTILRQLSYHIINNQDSFLGMKLNVRHGHVLIISTEDDAINMAALVRKQNTLGMEEDIRKRLGFYFKPVRNVKALEKILKRQPVDLIAVDTWGDNFWGDLNSNIAVREVLNPFKELAKKYGCFILFVHHTKKGSENKSPNKNQMIGSQGIEGLSRVVIDIRREEGLKRKLTIVKGNYTTDAAKSDGIILTLDPQTMLFERVGSASFGFSKVREYQNKDRLMQEIYEMHKDGLSQDAIVKKLKERYPNESTPAKGTVNDWIRNYAMVSQKD